MAKIFKLRVVDDADKNTNFWDFQTTITNIGIILFKYVK